MKNPFQKHTVIGIDISDKNIEILHLNGKEIISYARTLLPEGLVRDGIILKKEPLAEVLKKALLSAKPKSIDPSKEKIKVVINLPESKAFFHKIEVRSDNENITKEDVLKEAKKIIPIDLNKANWDYIEIGSRLEDSGYIKDIVFVGTLKEIVDNYKETIEMTGAEIVAVDMESLALGRSLLPSIRKTIKKGSIMIVDIGSRTTNINIFNSKNTLSSSVILPIGGGQFTEAIASEMKIDYDKAEQIKREVGFTNTGSDSNASLALQTLFKKITSEILRAIAFYEKENKESIVNIILAGGSSLLPSIDIYMSEETSKDVKLGDPSVVISNTGIFGGKKNPILFSCVIGLALKNIKKEEDIDLFKNDQTYIEKSVEDTPKKSSIKISKIFKNESSKKIFGIVFFIITMSILGFILYKYMLAPQKPKVASEAIDIVEEEIVEATISTSTEEVVLPIIEKEEEINVLILDTPTGWLNVRSGAGTTNEQVDRVSPNEEYLLLEENDNWYKIKINDNTEGWITSQYAEKIINN